MKKKTVGKVIQTLLFSHLFAEIIALRKNHEKGFALSQEIKNANFDVVAFFDADLINLNLRHLKKFIAPLSDKKIRAVLGVCGRNSKINDLLGFLSGERIYYKSDLMPFIEDMRTSKFGVETFLTYRLKHIKMKTIKLTIIYADF